MNKILMGATMWGGHIDTFLQWTLPSLMTEGNLPALCKEHHVQIDIHTDDAGRSILMNRLEFPPGVDFRIFTDVDKKDDKYEQLGRHQNADLREAKKIGADYHCLMPDFIYSNKGFEGVLKSGHKAICRLVLSTTKESMMPALEGYREYGKLSISAEALATISLKYIHPGVKHWLATKEGYPNTHVVAWEGKNTLHMCSPHCTPVYIANDVINISSYSWPLDSLLDQIIIGEIYCPKPDDGIVIAEISSKNQRSLSDARIDLVEFCRIFRWDTAESARQLYIFGQETIDPICRRMLGDQYWNDIEISTQKSKIIEALMPFMEI